jgi:hypothetical protein
LTGTADSHAASGAPSQGADPPPPAELAETARPNVDGRLSPGESVAELRGEIEQLRRDVRQTDEELDALQVTLARAEARSQRPWYRDGSLMLAILALLFSFGTTAVSYARLAQEDRNEARSELTGYLQRLGELPRLAAEVQLTHGDEASSGMSGFFNAETELTANQALSVMNRIPDSVTTTEYLTVGAAFVGAGSLSQADELYERALDVAKTPIERISALRSRGELSFFADDVASGRQLFRQARDVFAGETAESASLVALTDAYTEIRWGIAEINVRECEEGRSHVEEAERILEDRPIAVLVPLLDQVRVQLRETCP